MSVVGPRPPGPPLVTRWLRLRCLVARWIWPRAPR